MNNITNYTNNFFKDNKNVFFLEKLHGLLIQINTLFMLMKIIKKS